MIYMITYAAPLAEQRNEELRNAIRESQDWAILNDNTFLIKTAESIEELRDRLKNSIQTEQRYRLFVGKIAPPLAWRGYNNSFESWVTRVFDSEYRQASPEQSDNH